MSKDDKERDFDVLLKPIRDCIAKDWQIRLCNYLDKYLEYLQESGLINFSKAAFIVQNSSAYYSKRVDLMYNWVRHFAVSLTTSDRNSATEHSDSSQPKRQNKRRQLISDGLTCLPYTKPVAKIKNETIRLEAIERVPLNFYLKTLNKPNSSCGVIALNDEDMGYKEEYRLHWKLSNEGILIEDFYSLSDKRTIGSENESPKAPKQVDVSEVEVSDAADVVRDQLSSRSLSLNEAPLVDMNDVDDDDHHHNDDCEMEELLQTTSSLLSRKNDLEISQESGSQGRANISDEQVIETQEKERRRSTVDPFSAKIPYAALLIHRKTVTGLKDKLKKRFLARQSECKGKSGNRENNKKEEDINCYLSFSEILGGKKEDMIAFRLHMRRKHDRKIIKPVVQSPDQEDRDNSFNNYEHLDSVPNSDSDVEDNEEGIAALETSVTEAPIPSQPETVYDSNEKIVKVMTDFYKKRGDELQTAKTVAQWHSSIQHVIKSAEKNSIFDVHAYGTKILEQFQSIGESRLFSDIVAGVPQKEICRYLLSSLMLANTYNVEVSKTIPGELSKDCLELKLLSTVRHHEELDANVAATAGTST